MILQKILHTIRILALIAGSAFVSASLTGCSSEKGDAPVVDPDDITVSFRLYAGATSDTRAVDFEGTRDESHIDLDNLKILVFDENGVLKQVLYDDGNMPENTSFSELGQGFYIVRTKLDPEKYTTGEKFAIVALANWRSAADDTKLIADWNGHKIDETEVGKLRISDLKECVFRLNPQVEDNQPASWMPGNGKWIPMFGSRFTSIAGYDSAIFNEANPMPIPDVVLVRAFTKIEVENLDLSEDSPVIESIELCYRNQKGRLMQNYTFTGSTGNVASTSLPDEPSSTTRSIPFYQKDNIYTIYIPEMEFENLDSRRAIKVNIDLKDNVKDERWIYLCPYGPNGRPQLADNYGSDWNSIKRNYVYKYTINSLGFEFIIDVEPWKFGGKVHINLE